MERTMPFPVKKSFPRMLMALAILGCVGIGIWFLRTSNMQRRTGFADSWKTKCENVSESGKTQCWEDLTRQVLKENGIAPALDLIAYLYEKDPSFAEPCHAMVHIIGQAAYSQFRATGQVDLSEKNAFCAFGFYHGFMEMLIARKGTIVEAQQFCRYVDEKLGRVTPAAKFGCYHGIGHGSTDIHNPKYAGDERALIKPALANCEEFAADAEMLKLCVTGIFDSVALAYYNNGENGFVMKKNDPLWLCREQPARYKEACYLDMMPAIIWLGDHDLTKAGPILLAHGEKEYLPTAIRALAENSVRFIIHKKPVDMYLPYCRSLDGQYGSVCVSGLGVGLMQFGPPGKEYEEALVFCGSENLTSQEQDACMRELWTYIRQRYDTRTVTNICRGTDDRYKKYCL